MKCKYCEAKTAIHDLWCVKCGKPTGVIKNELSAMASLKATWNSYTPYKGANAPVGILATLIGIIPLLLTYIFAHLILTGFPEWQSVLMTAGLWVFILPLALIPLDTVSRKADYRITVGDFFSSFRKYPLYWFFSLLISLFYVAIYFICKGDAILNLVWLVLVQYWVVIIMPVPIIMAQLGLSPLQAIARAYRKCGDVRWNIYLLLIVLTIVNALACLFLLVGLIITVPFTWFAIRDYTTKLIEYEIFD